MSKREASNYLTDKNFNDEEIPEEAGQFNCASPDVLQSRQIKKAKRRGASNDDGSSPSATGGAFQGFMGLTGKPTSTSGLPSFNFAPLPAGGLSAPSFSFNTSSASSSSAVMKSSAPTVCSTASSLFSFTPAKPASTADDTLTISSGSSLVGTSGGLTKPSSFAAMGTSANAATTSTFSFGFNASKASTTGSDDAVAFGLKLPISSNTPAINFGFTTSPSSQLVSDSTFGPSPASGFASAAISRESLPVSSNAPVINFGFTGKNAALTANTTSSVHVAVSSAGGEPTGSSTSASAQHRQQLKNLNESLLKWVDHHVKLNPYCILTPVFDDYTQYVAELERKFPAQTTSSSQDALSSSSTLPKSSDSSVTMADGDKNGSFSSATTATATALKTSSVVSSTVTNVSAPSSFQATASSFVPASFGGSSSAAFTAVTTAVGTSTTLSSTSGFGTTSSGFATISPFGTSSKTGSIFGSTGGFTFGTAAMSKPTEGEAQQPASATTGNDEEEEYVPPKPEVVEIKEDDAFYTVRCKLFAMIDKEWKERGLGVLYLKPCTGDKTQLLIRADNTLGTILLNIMLTKSIPTKLHSKNVVSLSCVPNPPIDNSKSQTPVCMLIRVKTAESAAELLQHIDDNKK